MKNQNQAKWVKKLLSNSTKATALKASIAATILAGIGVGVAYAVKELNEEEKLSSEEQINNAFKKNLSTILKHLGSAGSDIDKFISGNDISVTTTIDRSSRTGTTTLIPGTEIVQSPRLSSSLLRTFTKDEIAKITLNFDLDTGKITQITKQTYKDTSGGLNPSTPITNDTTILNKIMNEINAIVADEIKAAAPPKAPTPPSTGSWSRPLPTVPVYKKATGTNEFTTVKTEGENYVAGQSGQLATLPPATGTPASIKVDSNTLAIKSDATVYNPALPAGNIYLKKGGSATEYTQVKTDADGYVAHVAEVPATVNGTSLAAGTGGSVFVEDNITLGTSGNGYVAHVPEVKDSVNGTALSTAGLDFSDTKITLGTSGNGYVAHVPEVKDKIGSKDLTTVGSAFTAANIKLQIHSTSTKTTYVTGALVSILYSTIDTGETYTLTQDATPDNQDPSNVTPADRTAIESQIQAIYHIGTGETTGKNPILYDGVFTGVVQDGAPNLAAAKLTATGSNTLYKKGNAETTGKNPVLYSGIYTGVLQDGAPNLAAAKSTATGSHTWYVAGSGEIVGQDPKPVVPNPTTQASITIIPLGGGAAVTYTAKTAADWDWSVLTPPSQPAQLFIKKGTTATDYDYVTNEALAEGYVAEVMPPVQSEADLQAAATDPSNADNKIMIDGSEYIWSTTKSAVVSVKPPGVKQNSFYIPSQTFADLYIKENE